MSFSAATFGKLETEAAFPDASLADYTDDPTIAFHRIFEFKRKSGDLTLSGR